jgi:hypothetical protein
MVAQNSLYRKKLNISGMDQPNLLIFVTNDKEAFIDHIYKSQGSKEAF